MPKTRISLDWGPDTPVGLPHSSKLIREVRNHSRRSKKKSLEGGIKSPGEKKSCPSDEGRQANPNQKYRVGGKVVEGKDFPGGQLPENARPSSPAPWKHTVKPSLDYLKRFRGRTKEAL